jgi:DnaK suppressor protein
MRLFESAGRSFAPRSPIRRPTDGVRIGETPDDAAPRARHDGLEEAVMRGRRSGSELALELTAALKAEHERLLGVVRALDAAQRALGESQEAESAAGGSLADVASDLAEQELDLTLARAEQARLADVEAALVRIAEGRFGQCLDCGRAIAAARLRALPWTAYCYRCAARRDGGEPPAPLPSGLADRLH